MRFLTLLILAVAALSPLAAAAEYLVMRSTSPRYAPGQVVDAFTLGEGEAVTVMTRDGSPLALEGPLEGRPAAAGGGGLMQEMADMLERRPMLLRMAGDRSGPGGEGGGLDLVAGGDWCVDPGAPGGPALALPQRPYARLLVLTPARGAPIEAVWPAGAATLDWPGAAAPRDGDRFSVEVDGASLGGFAIRPAPPAADDAMRRALSLEQAGCLSQAQATLERGLAE